MSRTRIRSSLGAEVKREPQAFGRLYAHVVNTALTSCQCSPAKCQQQRHHEIFIFSFFKYITHTNRFKGLILGWLMDFFKFYNSIVFVLFFV